MLVHREGCGKSIVMCSRRVGPLAKHEGHEVYVKMCSEAKHGGSGGENLITRAPNIDLFAGHA